MVQTEQTTYDDPDQMQRFMKCLLNDLRALEAMLAADQIESGVKRIGAEQEMFLTDEKWQPARLSMEILKEIDDEDFTPELAQFNLETNLPPLTFSGDCLSRMEHTLLSSIDRVQEVAGKRGARVVLAGILPTVMQSDVETSSITPLPRYEAINAALSRHRGAEFEFRLTGTDELIVRHDSVMLEAANTSCQFHFQVSPSDFAKYYNIAQLVTGPVLAAATNSPLLFGRRLWKETRIALFQQATDTRSPGHQLDERSARVSFGRSWVKSCVTEIFREDISRFRVLLSMPIDEDPFQVMEDGGIPKLKALQLFNGTIYRWNRPCYGVYQGKPHLRIENRAIPSGPSALDEMANAAFWFGLVSGTAHRYGDVSELIDFDLAKTNFISAARLGFDTHLTWLDGARSPARTLIREQLAPLARFGLEHAGIEKADIDRYMGVIEARCEKGQCGSQWMLDSFSKLSAEPASTKAECLGALTAAIWSRQNKNLPVHEWTLAEISEVGSWKCSLQRVEQVMTTDVYSIHQDDVIDLAASLMDWQHIRHIPIVDDSDCIVGIISYRRLLRLLAHDTPHGRDDPIPAREIMHPDPITVPPETPTLEAIEIMRTNAIPCLPVVKRNRVVGVVTERDFISVAAMLLKQQLAEA